MIEVMQRETASACKCKTKGRANGCVDCADSAEAIVREPIEVVFLITAILVLLVV